MDFNGFWVGTTVSIDARFMGHLLIMTLVPMSVHKVVC